MHLEGKSQKIKSHSKQKVNKLRHQKKVKSVDSV